MFTIDKSITYTSRKHLIIAADKVQHIGFHDAERYRIAKVIKDYCGVLNEESIRKNFILVYELLDEMLDYGYPQGTSTESLKGYIYNEAAMLAQQVKKTGGMKLGKKTKHSSAVNKPIAMSRRR